MIQQKVEIRFEKGASLRFISHHDLMRAFQRAVRRAGWPVRMTEGFNPRPRIVFPVALEVGIASLDEAAEIELTQWIPLPILKERLSPVLPPGLLLRRLSERPRTRQAQTPLRLHYRLHLSEAGVRVPPETLAAWPASATLPFVRQRTSKGRPPRAEDVDLRPNLESAALDPTGDMLLVIRPSPHGLARPLEFLSLAIGRPLAEIRHVRVTKLRMELSGPAEEVSPVPPHS